MTWATSLAVGDSVDQLHAAAGTADPDSCQAEQVCRCP
jgi:hypothetical protein